jgi:hypothetical protein
MTNYCFSKSELYTIRNEIDVRMLIEKTLCIPCRVTQGCFRFMCPLCKGFNTAVNPKTNLARCFACEKNFNTIDLVMLIRQTDFVHSVKFLQSIFQKDVFKPDAHQILSGSNPKSGCRPKHKPLSGKPDKGACHIGRIIGDVFPPDDGGLPEKPITALDNPHEDRITELEIKLEYLGRQIQELTRIITDVIPSKYAILIGTSIHAYLYFH